jgi:hypothetical protein
VTSPVVTQNPALPARAITWTRRTGEMMLRIVGDAEPILRGHVNELATITIVRHDGAPLVTFNGVLRGYKSQGKMYVIAYFPRRMAPMWGFVKEEEKNGGDVPLLITLSGVKVRARGLKKSKEVKGIKEEGRRGDG